ncbi:YoaK family protein [Marinilactibacillus psychrotolerans]|uniref:DUF1275 domain-containing protein n=2 Tax=Marinilactibacillus psychrotolerans TaxID=191770 RepID=A0A511GZ83_9LACT|nr:YoaK family protein [Marinilactibacillus psychrotolerans]TLQ08433.1 DUF1275 domain-containing protein [Marinilactibacillus psychrotolerans]SDC08189.1 Uncharacterized membrane protein YoaK, UPF0700 family [Marinilactibacillus psychrotolerans]SJN25198.1 hypothetical protein FM115_03280 [Marinilactibacillus psychrotolerans 42ea]GEL65879.1 membrane protein [Marinilactibacillus psychrotolerans]GEQ32606.1 membrane protein [Marinilactibacillus psychrotolerans]
MDLSIKRISSYENYIHYSMCMLGGFFGSYALLLRGNFGSAQTANLIQLFINVSAFNLFDILFRTLALFLFVLFLMLSFYIKDKYTLQSVKICLLVEIISVLAIGLIPSGANDLMALLPLFALTAFQWGMFNGTKEYTSPTLFSTGNIRQCISGWIDYKVSAKAKSKMKALFYSYTLIYYHLGVLAGIALTYTFGAKGIFICLVPLFINLMIEMKHIN